MIREYFSNDILTSLIIFSILLIFVLKKINSQKFYENFSFNKKTLINKLSNNDYLSFRSINVVYLLVFVINTSILFAIFKNDKFNFQDFLKFATLLSLFILLKLFLEKFIGWLFNFKKKCDNYLTIKFKYLGTIGLYILMLNIVCIYSSGYNYELVYISLIISLLCLIISYFTIFFSFKNIIYKNWFYFILYLCTLEIIPYYYIISNIINV
jgi:hypothetical protein